MSADPIEVVRRFWDELWTQGDAELAKVLFTENAQENGARVDVEVFAQAVARWKQIFPDFTVTVEELAPLDDRRVFSRVTYRGTHRDTWAGLPATGKSFEVIGLDVFSVEDGRISELWHSTDHYELAYQLGARLTLEGE